MSPSKSSQHYCEPAAEDRGWLPGRVEFARGLVVRYTGLIGWPENQLEDLERACRAWSVDTSEDKARPAEVAEACGAVVGAWVARRVGLKWMLCESAGRRDLVLWGRSASGADVVADPVAVVTKRMAEGLTEFLVELAEALREDLASALAK